MHRIRPIAVSIDRQLGEMDNLLTGLLFLAERVEEAEMARYREAGVSLLNVVGDRLRACRRQVETLHQIVSET